MPDRKRTAPIRLRVPGFWTGAGQSPIRCGIQRAPDRSRPPVRSVLSGLMRVGRRTQDCAGSLFARPLRPGLPLGGTPFQGSGMSGLVKIFVPASYDGSRNRQLREVPARELSLSQAVHRCQRVRLVVSQHAAPELKGVLVQLSCARCIPKSPPGRGEAVHRDFWLIEEPRRPAGDTPDTRRSAGPSPCGPMQPRVRPSTSTR